MFKFQHCSSFAFNFISSFFHLNWLELWWGCKNTGFSTRVWSFGVSVLSPQTPRNNNWEILFLCSLDFQLGKFLYLQVARKWTCDFFSEGESGPKWAGEKSLLVSSKLTDFLLNLQFQPNEVLCCYLSVISWRAFGNLLNSSVGTIFERRVPSGEDTGFVRKQENRFLMGLLFVFTEVWFTANRF